MYSLTPHQQTNAEAGEQLEVQQEALRAGAHEERSALERRAAELGTALDEARAKLATSETRVDRADQFATQLKRERDESGMRHLTESNALLCYKFSFQKLNFLNRVLYAYYG